MRGELETRLLNVILPRVDRDAAEDLRFRITMILGEYDISKSNHEIVPYQGGINTVVLQRFLAAKIAKGCSRKTIEYYKTIISSVLEKIGKPYSEVTADDIRLYIAARIHKGEITKVSADNERRVLQAFFRWMTREEMITRNPMDKVDCIKIRKKRKKAFDLMEMEKIRAACKDRREKAIVEVLASTWCRVSELVSIRIDAIDGDKVLICGKGDKEREVYLNARAKYSIEQYLKDRDDKSPYLFVTTRKIAGEVRPLSAGAVEQCLAKIGKRAGVSNCHPHRFRRTGATMALRAGMPLITVSKLLGHESVETTQIYLDISDKDLGQAHEKYVF